ncbi:MAG: ABC transporter ATP-binding protein [Alphaproteobacteria bacterium]|nr:ABC transporter ATP-binding protein [Alphaproteobacteria bacterium]
MSNPVLIAKELRKHFGDGDNRIDVLRGANVTLNASEMVALVGPSGSGKSTLLQIIGLLDKADSGELIIGNETVIATSDDQRTKLRSQRIGFVYQFHHLLPEFSALENVSLPQMIAGKSADMAAARSKELLTKVGLEKRLTHRPAELSGGEQQRVAIARALANKPQLLIADEPTGNLDHTNSDMVFNVLRDVCINENVAILMATHNLELARQLNRVIEMKDGIISEAA